MFIFCIKRIHQHNFFLVNTSCHFRSPFFILLFYCPLLKTIHHLVFTFLLFFFISSSSLLILLFHFLPVFLITPYTLLIRVCCDRFFLLFFLVYYIFIYTFFVFTACTFRKWGDRTPHATNKKKKQK